MTLDGVTLSLDAPDGRRLGGAPAAAVTEGMDGAEFAARVGRRSESGGGARPRLLEGAGWAGLGPHAWAAKAMGALNALTGQLWRLWQEYLARVAVCATSFAPLRRHSALYLQRRGAGSWLGLGLGLGLTLTLTLTLTLALALT